MTVSKEPRKAQSWLPKRWDKETDVIIVGAGGAGLFAAIEAYDAGATLLLLEKSPSLYTSATAMSGGGVAVSDNKIYRKAGISYPPSRYNDILMAYGKHSNIPELLRTFVEKSGETIDKLLDMDLPEPSIYGMHKPLTGPEEGPRLGLPTGKAYIEVLEKHITARDISILFETRATRLIQDPITKRVLGVEAKMKEDTINVKGRKAVILATGGFFSNTELYDRYLTNIKQGLHVICPYSTGNGLQMAQIISADTTHMHAAATSASGLVRKAGVRSVPHLVPPIASRHIGGIYVNKVAKRFYREDVHPAWLGAEILPNEPDKVYFYILDSHMWEEWKRSKLLTPRLNKLLTTAFGRKLPWVHVADTIRDLAAKLKLNPDALEETIAKWNKCCDLEEDPEFKRTTLLYKIENPPFYSIGPIHITVLITLGGLRVNTKCQVLDTYNNTIPALYAAGEIMGGVHGELYHGGTALAKAFTFGRVAGKNAAKEKPWE